MHNGRPIPHPQAPQAAGRVADRVRLFEKRTATHTKQQEKGRVRSYKKLENAAWKYWQFCHCLDEATGAGVGTLEIREEYPNRVMSILPNHLFGTIEYQEVSFRDYMQDKGTFEDTLDVVRKEVQDYDGVQGYRLCYSLDKSGGIGVMPEIREEYPDRFMSIFSTEKVNTSAVLSFHEFVKNSDQSVMMDNEMLYDICARMFKTNAPSCGDMNHLISNAISATSCCIRFPDQLNCHVPKIAMSMIPLPRLQLFMNGCSTSNGSQQYRAVTVPELTQQMFDAKNMMCAADPRIHRYLKDMKMELTQQMFDAKNMMCAADPRIHRYLREMKMDDKVIEIKNEASDTTGKQRRPRHLDGGG